MIHSYNRDRFIISHITTDNNTSDHQYCAFKISTSSWLVNFFTTKITTSITDAIPNILTNLIFLQLTSLKLKAGRLPICDRWTHRWTDGTQRFMSSLGGWTMTINRPNLKPQYNIIVLLKWCNDFWKFSTGIVLNKIYQLKINICMCFLLYWYTQIFLLLVSQSIS